VIHSVIGLYPTPQSGRSLICGSVTKTFPGVVEKYREKKSLIITSLWVEIQTGFCWVRRKCAVHLATSLYEQNCMNRTVWTELYEQNYMNRIVWTELYEHNCMNRIVWTELYEQNYMNRIVWTELYEQNCMNRIVWTELYEQNCMNRIVWTELYEQNYSVFCSAVNTLNCMTMKRLQCQFQFDENCMWKDWCTAPHLI
jgi:hypothetical protein